jgi:hypothetical protein
MLSILCNTSSGDKRNGCGILISSSIRFDLSKGFMLESGVMKDMGKKDQEEEKWPII